MKPKARIRGRYAALLVLPMAAALAMCDPGPAAPVGSVPESDNLAAAMAGVSGHSRTFPVSGSAVHYFTTAIIHSQEPVPGGMIQRSTEIIQLTGDVSGYILYHPTSTFDFESGTLVNTGTQLFSGTIGDSDPLVLHDDRFRFQVDLSTGETLGTVHLGRSSDAPHKGTWYECDLTVVGTGMTPDGDGLADYSGTCSRRGRTA